MEIQKSVDVVAAPWVNSPYYEEAEKWTFLFWSPGSLFRKYFDELDLDRVIELACGHGRHAEIIQHKVGKAYLMDVLEENVEFCRQRFGTNRCLEFVTNDGYTFRPIEQDSVTSIFCYDAMVHFSPDIVASYVADTRRVLKPGHFALFHHSNYAAPTDQHYGLNPHARNHMPFALFESIAAGARMTIVASEAIPWGDVPQLDRLTLLRKD